MSNRRAGRATVTVDGVVWAVMAGVTLDEGGETRSPVNTDSGTVGFTGEMRPATLTVTVPPLAAGESSSKYNFADGVTTIRWDTGQTYIISPSWSTGETTQSKDGLQIVINGPQAKEIV